MTPQELEQLAEDWELANTLNPGTFGSYLPRPADAYEAGFRKALELLIAVQDDLGWSLANTPEQLIGYM